MIFGPWNDADTLGGSCSYQLWVTEVTSQLFFLVLGSFEHLGLRVYLKPQNLPSTHHRAWKRVGVIQKVLRGLRSEVRLHVAWHLSNPNTS